MLAVLVTIAAWYLIDPIYNSYQGYVQAFGDAVLLTAWWEVLLFLISFSIFVPLLHHRINGNLFLQKSQIFRVIRLRIIDTDEFQDQVDNLAKKTALMWVMLMLIALFRVDFYFPGLFFPYLSPVGLIDPWGRGRMGGGLDALFALATYLQIMLTAMIGVTLALGKRGPTMSTSGIIYFLALPYFIFGRTRNTMIAVIIPCLMALVTLRIKGGVVVKILLVFIIFILFNIWFLFILQTRSQGMDISQGFKSGGLSEFTTKNSSSSKHHEGFNMFEELGYINYFISNGTYKPNWGERYFAEVVNPIPRALWPSKPLIGIDYAIARGMAYGDQGSSSGGIAASISTGMIGQGVVNFGPMLGPVAAAFLMAFWVAVLARQDLMGKDLGYLLLYAIGLVLTFNMGRDITLLVIYPFVFGWILLTWINKRKARAS